MNQADFWRLFERHNAEAFPTFAAWADEAPNLNNGERALARHYGEGWAASAFATFKGLRSRGIASYIDRPLAFPDAAKAADLFEAARFLPTQGGAHTHQQGVAYVEAQAGGPGFLFCSGDSRGQNAAPCGHMGGKRGWVARFLEKGEHVREHRGGRFFGTYAKPREPVRAHWSEHIGDPDGSLDFSLGGFEFVERDDGVLVIGRAGGSGIFTRWLALLDVGASLVDLMPESDRAFIAAEHAAEVAAWGAQ